jgi:hypothetical protein
MPRETRLLGYGLASRGTRQVKIDPNGQPEIDPATGQPVMVDITELLLVCQRTGDTYILPLTEEGVDLMKRALTPSPLVVPPAGLRL